MSKNILLTLITLLPATVFAKEPVAEQSWQDCVKNGGDKTGCVIQDDSATTKRFTKVYDELHKTAEEYTKYHYEAVAKLENSKNAFETYRNALCSSNGYVAFTYEYPSAFHVGKGAECNIALTKQYMKVLESKDY